MKQNLLKSLFSIIMLMIGVNVWGYTYKLYTSSTISKGDYILVGYQTSSKKYYAMNNTVTSNQYLGITEVSISDDAITESGTAIVWNISASTNGYYIKNGSNYLDDNATSTKNYAKTVTTPTTTSEWVFSYDSSAKTWSITNYGTTTTKKTLSTNIGSSRVACYTAVQNGNNCFYLYKKDESGKTSTTTSFGKEAKTEYTAYLGETFTAPTATVDNGGTIKYESSNTNVATVEASTGTVTLVGAGSTVIKASYAGNDTYNESSASYTLNVGKIYATLAALVADGKPTTTGIQAKVSLTDEVITKIAVSNNVRNGIYLSSGSQQVEIFCNDVPDAWEINGKVSGTITGTWKLYSSTWELCPSDWTQLSYTAAPKKLQQ